jgi:hypothetical protein
MVGAKQLHAGKVGRVALDDLQQGCQTGVLSAKRRQAGHQDQSPLSCGEGI